MTEEEAKTKPCIGLVPSTTGKWVVRPDGREVWVCSGSACMAWRWEPDTKRGDGPLEELTLPRGRAKELERRPGFLWVSGKPDGDEVPWGLFPRLGFCGLAGKP